MAGRLGLECEDDFNSPMQVRLNSVSWQRPLRSWLNTNEFNVTSAVCLFVFRWRFLKVQLSHQCRVAVMGLSF